MSDREHTAKTPFPRGLFATLSGSGDADGSRAPALGRHCATLVVLALAITASALTAAPALAAPPTVTTPVISGVSYTTAHLTGKVSGDGGTGAIKSTTYSFQYSTDNANWTTAKSETLFGTVTEHEVEADLSLESATHYYVRLIAGYFLQPADQAKSPEPNPEFTTLTADPPTIPGAVEASNVFSTSATATAAVRRPAASDDVTCRFEVVTEEQFTTNGFEGAATTECAENPIKASDAETDKPVSAHLSGLAPETTYHLRLSADSAAPGVVTKDSPSTFTTAAKVAAPSVLTIDDAFEVGKRSAKVSGEVQRPPGADPALDTSCRFEYVTDEQFTSNPPGEEFAGAGQAPCVEAPPENPLTGTDPTPVSAELNGLDSDPTGVTYHLRLAAENGGGTVTQDAATTFTTLPIMPPTLTVDSITDVGYTSFRVIGTADPGNQGVYPGFQYSPVGTEEWAGSGPGQIVPLLVEAGSPAHQYSMNFPCYYVSDICTPPLKPGTTYQVRMYGYDNEFGGINHELHYSAESEFTTKGTSTPPSATLDPVTGITGTTAHFSGTVDTHAPAGPLPDEAKAAYDTDWHFECTPECPDSTGVSHGTIEAEQGIRPVTFNAAKLTANSHYEVKLVAHNELGTVESVVEPFDTDLIKPTVIASPGASDGEGGYTIAGVVNPNASEVTSCEFKWGPNAPNYAFGAPCSPAPGSGGKPVTVEAHLTGLTPGATYHFNLFATNAAGKQESGDLSFVPTLNPKERCPNEALRKENSSLSLPECRAYEQVSNPFKEGYEASLSQFTEDGDTVKYLSKGANIANSGQSSSGFNFYVATRSSVGWKTISDLNGSSGSLFDSPSDVVPISLPTGINEATTFSRDLLSSVWTFQRKEGPSYNAAYLRRPDGTFTLIGEGSANVNAVGAIVGASDDLSHVLLAPTEKLTSWGPGVYEFVGTGNHDPERVDVDNFGAPATTCTSRHGPDGVGIGADAYDISNDGRIIVFTIAGGCGGANHPSNQVLARIGDATSINLSASQCTRPDCNAPADAAFAAAAADGSRVFFTTTQQLVNGDIDQTNDLYACDVPAGTPNPQGPLNPCPHLIEATGAGTEANLDPPIGGANSKLPASPAVLGVSEDGSTAFFVSKAVLATNDDALGEPAQPGNRNLYAWRTDAAHPDGQTKFVGALLAGENPPAKISPDGRYLALQTHTPLLFTDTDGSADVYRYAAETGELERVSTAVSGAGGNGEGFDAIAPDLSDDGRLIVFWTVEALAPRDENGEPDIYLWSEGRVSLVSSGAVGGGSGVDQIPTPFAITGSGRDIYFETPAHLSPSDGDTQPDVYDARIGGGFSFVQSHCGGETCQPQASLPPVPKSLGSHGAGPGNPPPPKPCPKGKLKKHGRCVKKPHKKHQGKKGEGHAKRASHDRGGGK